MMTKLKIAINVSDATSAGRHFSLKLKKELDVERCEFRECAAIVAISDAGSDFMAFRQILMHNEVIDKNYKWQFSDGHLVILGEWLSANEQVVECLWLIYSLEERAKKQGGRVHFIQNGLAAHNLNAAWRNVHPRYAATSRTPYTALYYGNNELWRWLLTKNVIEKIGSTLFADPYLSPDLLFSDLSLPEINSIARRAYNTSNDGICHPFWCLATEQQIDGALHHFKVSTIATARTTAGSNVLGYGERLRMLD